MTWTQQRIKYQYSVVDQRAGNDQPPLLAVSIHRGVIPRSAITDDLPRAEDLSNYKLCEPGDIVLNRMRAFQGAIGISPERGLVSPDYMVLRPSAQVEARFFHHLFRSKWFVGEMISRLRGIGGTESGMVRTPRINPDDLGDISIQIPSLDEQRRIADFLDAETARIDELVSYRYQQLELMEQRAHSEALQAIRGIGRNLSMHPSGLDWLGDVAAGWPIAAVSHQFEVLLGKMLNQERTQGDHLRPYLRNTNVQWDRIDTNDLLRMDFPPEERTRYAVLKGDLLVCEGGHPGRSAVWNGDIDEIYYQKALHRARPRGYSSVRWLYYCLLAATALNVFAVHGNSTTISHLTGEQLRAHRFPFPERAVQDEIVSELDRLGQERDSLAKILQEQLSVLAERRQALITAAVTGQFDVSAARGADLS